MYKLMSTREYLCFDSHIIILKETSQKPVQFITSVLSSGDTSSNQELMNSKNWNSGVAWQITNMLFKFNQMFLICCGITVASDLISFFQLLLINLILLRLQLLCTSGYEFSHKTEICFTSRQLWTHELFVKADSYNFSW